MSTTIPSGEIAVPSAQLMPGFDPASTIDALNAGLADYLNQPVRDILAQLGLTVQPTTPDGMPPPGAAGPPPSPPGGLKPELPSPSTNHDTSGGRSSNSIDPSQMIKPVTDALGTLGSGQFSGADPAGMFDGISKAMDDAGGSLSQALSGMDGAWRGDAASAADGATRAAIKDGAEISIQAQRLRTSLMTATAAVQEAQARLTEIVAEFWATIAAIGPNIIFPWGIAAAVAAAMEAVSEASEVMVETQNTLSGAAARVFDDGAPVSVATSALQNAAAPGASSLLRIASQLPSPALQSLNAFAGMGSGLASAPDLHTDDTHLRERTGSPPGGAQPPRGSFGGGLAPGGGGTAARPTLAPLHSSVAAGGPGHQATSDTVARTALPGGGASNGAPMAGGAGMSPHAGAGADGKHTAASYLHTAGQGEQIVGEAFSVAPPVVGEMTTIDSPDIELRI